MQILNKIECQAQIFAEMPTVYFPKMSDFHTSRETFIPFKSQH